MYGLFTGYQTGVSKGTILRQGMKGHPPLQPADTPPAGCCAGTALVPRPNFFAHRHIHDKNPFTVPHTYPSWFFKGWSKNCSGYILQKTLTLPGPLKNPVRSPVLVVQEERASQDVKRRVPAV